MSAHPNILYIICHDLGRCLNCFGRGPIESPNLDRLASEGMRFTNHFCTSTFCSPSRGGITTGRYPHSNGLMGLVNLGWELPASETTTQEHLKGAGYESYLFGGQHERHDPHSLGYDHVDVTTKEKHTPDAIAKLLASGPKQPFYLNYFISPPHRPFLKEGWPGPAYGEPDYDAVPDPGESVWVPPYLPDNAIVRKEMGGFQQLVKTMDSYVGRVLDGLDKSGLAEETLVVFITDHGIDMPRAKGTLYDPGIETTLIMRWPGKIAPGTACDELLSNVDLLPTLLEIAEFDVPENIQGRSYLPLIENREYSPRDEIFAELNVVDPIRRIRTRTHKLLFNVTSHRRLTIPSCNRMDLINTVPDVLTQRRPLAELYDLEKNPLETDNLWGNPDYRQIQDDLKARLRKWMEETDDPVLEGVLPIPKLLDQV